MEAFVSRKKRKLSPDTSTNRHIRNAFDEDSTDVKLATLASLYPGLEQVILLETLITSNGSVEEATQNLAIYVDERQPPGQKVVGYQSSLHSAFGLEKKISRAATKKGQTLHLYSLEDVAAHTPCSIIHNFLPAEEANGLLLELLAEAPSYERQAFKMFENVVYSPHTASFYVESLEEKKKHQTEYLYQGGYLNVGDLKVLGICSQLQDVRELLPQMRAVSARVEEAVNKEVEKRIKSHYPGGQKLQYQSPERWKPNCAFVNCYDGGRESVGYHSDQLTYVGPRAIIGSISLGVAREFRVRKVVAKDDNPERDKVRDNSRADAEGQVAIHLPHNSLLVMHAEMQEEWKVSWLVGLS